MPPNKPVNLPAHRAAPSKDPLDEQPGSPLLVPPKHARGKRSVTPQRKRQYRRPRVPAVDAAPQAALMRPEAQYQQHQARYQGQAVAMLADLTPAQRQQLLLHHAILMQRQRQVALQAQQAGLPGQRGSLPAQGPLRLQPTGPRQTAQAQAQQAQQQRHAAQLFAAQQARMFAPGQAPAVRPGAGGCAPHAFLGFQTPYGAAAAYGAGPLPQHAYPQQAYPPPQHLRGQVRPADPAPSVPAAALSYGDLIRRCSPTPELSGTPSLPNGASPHASGGGAAEAASPFLPSTGDWSLPHFSHASPSLTQLLRGGSGAQQSQGPLVFVPDISPGAG
ncbi:hypothetical protein F751_5001 [Auxenochlorella protothecoides]|uniref:Uncharacterized protein n=1 Tax=Auxenochlorella protothecoides TaxID=3075 RepID=A0A087SEK5_AUXPR|nr:hypothetical protein F751_5001 [Auxenochlorella protothecoides]KFM24159.1 hypothetical protein F751_5001 [Auxenochlorella protothecoides]